MDNKKNLWVKTDTRRNVFHEEDCGIHLGEPETKCECYDRTTNFTNNRIYRTTKRKRTGWALTGQILKISTKGKQSVGFEVLTAVVKKSSIFWDITPCSPLNGSASRWFRAWLIIRPWRWRRHDPPNRWTIFNGLHCILSQKIEVWKTECRGDLSNDRRILFYNIRNRSRYA
jgi:hypothetical protein